ncbi:hypothetical protein LEN26_012079 [Aphanomyces euteiches]|nr:hypothetical protein LEN26_012079 [Aphanomyces euteiches]KAH9123565.1 hypothetical protein AeMF1_005469 [Aphanomyces euteiches]KAH9188381.1 hypothetical protein AeNC1_009645 [Aphanomyces euteiches]
MLKRTFQHRRLVSRASSSLGAPARQARQFSTAPGSAGGGNGGLKISRQAVANEAIEVFKLLFGTVTVLLGGSMAMGYATENYKRMHPPTPPGQLVDIDIEGHKSTIHAQVQSALGSGPHDVVVILDGSLGETSFDWEKVAAEISDVATVVAIDRPGLAFSTPGVLPRSAATIAKEYRAVLDKLEISKPVILVGHGTGGYNMRQLASDLLDDPTANTCLGLVLVDAMHESVKPAMDALSPAVQEALASRQKNANTLLKMSHFGLIRLVHFLQSKRNATRFSTTALPYVDYFTPTPVHRRGVVKENKAIGDIEASLLASPTPSLGIPLVVLSHGDHTMFKSMLMEPGIDESIVEHMEAEWSRGQTEQLKLSPRSVQRVIPAVGHDIPHEKPEEVAAAILAVLNESQGHKTSGLASLKTQECPIK